MKKYEGHIEERNGWGDNVYQVEKDDHCMTGAGNYRSFFQIGEDRFVVFPYWHDQDHPVIMSAAELAAMIAVK